ncbi:hypothetical protein [Sphingomonas crocodyli]|uniref:Uncharacterized protein n=1 Tax=Sphingomonas crocodyli TaxID=1979270 RepID=A0A437LVR5_9SPHN|nr:hypothetical protein [Sphingomonas crocodyli]RVT89473.1 hypothetical protein EOD43_22185 [Sphingomonas crocodyli]
MQGGIAQTIGLVFAANARRRKINCPEWPGSSIYQFCKEVRFVGRKRSRLFGLSTKLEIADPNAWLDTLPSDMTCARLSVLSRSDASISDRESVGFANGGPMFLVQIVGSTPEAWYSEWQVTNQGAPDRRIWSVTYRNLPNAVGLVEQRSPSAAREALASALQDAISFSESHGMGFGYTFEAARRALNDESPLSGFYHADIVPEGLLSLSDLQLFSAAAKAWVFGGMGSWNDVWFDGDDQEDYRKVSDQLFLSIVDGLACATNASADA